jgi:hypothetical protein
MPQAIARGNGPNVRWHSWMQSALVMIAVSLGSRSFSLAWPTRSRGSNSTAKRQCSGRKEGSDVHDTVQAKLMELGLLQPEASGTGWELTQQARELFSDTLTSPHKSKLAADLLKLGMIEPGPVGSGLWWVFTPRGRDLLTYLLNNPVSIDQPDPDSDAGAVE